MSEMNPLSFFEEDVTEEINHGIRVSNLAYCVAKELGLYEEQCHELALAGMMHDIGKLYVSGYLYGRDKDTLKIEEMKYVRLHPRLGYDELMRLDFSDFVLESILYHHENSTAPVIRKTWRAIRFRWARKSCGSATYTRR